MTPKLHIATQGSGPPLVLLHGLFLGSMAQWYFTAAPVLARSHTVVMFDLRSHGRSERMGSGYDLQTLVEDLRQVLRSLGIEGPVALAGHSYGGLIALRYAQIEPVTRLALVDVPLPGLSREGALASPEALLESVPDPVRKAVMGGGRRSRRLLESLHFLTSQSTLMADLEAEKPLEDLASMTVPTLLVYGDQSGCRDSLERLECTLREVRSVTLPGGHFLPIEAAGALTEELLGFFDG